ncbi:hypothetical protein E2C01_040465 [Portunus trituberculatus]|uniref:Uncharacterized protein n=1 Tax=Portunus trituberculatus TaxID=210409 RepID=A0A5B7FND3_PORTR|nr:hypothetical protein [Portunus trituberculatus]
MADKSPGKQPASKGGDDRGRTEKHKRSLLSKVSFFEQVWWGQNRSPSLERRRPVSREGTKSPEVEMAEEVFAEWSEGPGQEKRPRRDGASPPIEGTPRRSSSRSEDEWEFVEGPDTSTLAEDIERRLAERRRMRSGSDMSPTREWVTLRRRSKAFSEPAGQRGSTPESLESSTCSRTSLADTIEQRLERHRQEVRQRLASPTPEWPQLRCSPVPRSSRDTSLERDRSVRSRTTSGERRGSRESSLSPRRHVLEREVIAKAERRDGAVTAVTTTRHTTMEWDSPDGEPRIETQSTSKDLEEEDPASAGQEGYQRVEEEERESIESGTRKKYSHVVVHRTTEQTITSTPSPEPSEHLPSEQAATSPLPDSPDSHSARSRTPSGPRKRHRSRTPSVERILEVEEDDSSVTSGKSRTELRASSAAGEHRHAGAGGASSRHTYSKRRDSDERAKESSMDSKSSDDGLTMEAVSSVQWESDGARGEVQRHTTRVLIRDRDPSYTKYVLTARTASRDSLFSTPSSEDAPSLEGSVPPWVSRSAQYEDGNDDAPGVFRLRSHRYQEHISTMKGEATAAS